MRKIYSFVVAMILGVMGFAAQAEETTFTININDASGVTASYGNWFSSTVVALQDGENTLTFDEEVYLTIEANDGYGIASVLCNNEEEYLYSPSYYSLAVNSDINGNVYDINVVNIKENRTAKCGSCAKVRG